MDCFSKDLRLHSTAQSRRDKISVIIDSILRTDQPTSNSESTFGFENIYRSFAIPNFKLEVYCIILHLQAWGLTIQHRPITTI